jgi:hypothetical protein
VLLQETERTTAEVALPPQVNCSDEEDSSTSNDDYDLFQPSSDEDTPTKDEEIRVACAWGMDAGITVCLGNPYKEYCCMPGRANQIRCNHTGCNGIVHRMCQLNWLHKRGIVCANRDPVFCPEHNSQRLDYIRKWESHDYSNISR